MRSFLLISLLATASVAHAQQPAALPGAPTAPAPGMPPAAAPTAPAVAPPKASPGTTDFQLGHRYEVTLNSGTTFTGTLTLLSLENLEFDTADLGHLVVPRANLSVARDVSPVGLASQRAGYYDIGSGSRYFFAPSGRNLRRGEGAAQTVNLYLVGVNYGITDNISLGGYVSAVPGVPIDNQLLVFTPKIGTQLSADVNLGAGVLYMRVPNFDSNGRGYGLGLLYGVLTKGSADNNATIGVGYGFAGGNVGSTPVLLVGGQRRISRRVSLMTENYLIANSNSGMGGLYGIKLNWRRTNLGIAGAYVLPYSVSPGDPQFLSSYIIPVYFDFTFRFGSPYPRAVR